MFETMIAGALLPAAIDLIKGAGGALSRRFLGLSVDDQIKLQNADIERLKALADLDNPFGTPTQWVVDLRGSFRYVAAIVVILVGAGVLYAGVQYQTESVIDMGFSLVGLPFAFIFGERLVLGLKGPGKK